MNKLIYFFYLLLAGQLQGAIILNGQLQLADTIDISRAMGDNFIMSIDGDSVVNIYYEDRNAQWAGAGFLEPAIRFNLNAKDSAVVNFIIPESDTFSFYINDEKDLDNNLSVFAGLVLTQQSYLDFSIAGLYRSYPGYPYQITVA